MYNLDLTSGKYPIIIKPNLGQPILINLRDYKDDSGRFIKKLDFEVLIITVPDQTTQEILQFFHLNLFIQPLLNDEGEFSDRRGEKYLLKPLEIDKIQMINFEDSELVDEENCILLDLSKRLLHIDNLFGNRKILYKVKFSVKNIAEIDKFLKEIQRSFLIFDIVHDLPNTMESKVNYHSIAMFDKDWTDFKFIHATDFHVARRNDFISNFLKSKVKENNERYRKKKKKLHKIDTLMLTRDFKFSKEFQEHRLDELREAKYNFNYNLRLLIEFINKRVKKNKLDFVLMTGDLIDYIQIARGNYQYKNNFQVFQDILLGVNRGLDKPPHFKDDEFINKKEIIAPIFTIVGNHDYRKGHYSLKYGAVHKIFGLNKEDIKGYSDVRFFNYFKALYSRNKFLKDYFRYFNPNLNFRLKIGEEYSFIFLDTGQDSIADMHDLLKGGPSTKGLKDYQIKLLRDYIQLCYDEKIIVVMHTPPISPNLSYFKKLKFKRRFKIKNRALQWSDFYEHNLKNYVGDGRLDKILNLKYQTIMYNWVTLLKIFTGSDKIIRRKIDLVLCGHTHTLKEYKLKEAKKDDSETINFGFYLAPIYVNVPCEVYTNKYRELFNSFKDIQELKIWFDVNKPFVFQTQAIGPISQLYKYKPPGFRSITVRESQIKRVNIYSLHIKEDLTTSDKEALQELGL
jgi:predicted MPP superfamily phosphohydrolase